MNSSKISCLLVTLSMILISHSLVPAYGQSLYENVCKETDEEDNGACLQLLKDDPRIPSATNYIDLSKFILDFAIKKVTEGQKNVTEIAKTNPSEAIHECVNTWYNITISSFQTSLNVLTENPQISNYDAFTAGNGAVICGEALASEKIDNPTISNTNKMVVLLSNIAFLATTHIL